MKHNSKYIFTTAGFTLMEMLVAVVIFGMLGIIATQSLFSLFRGAAKTEAIKEVKQNGDYALSVLEISIHNAVGVVVENQGRNLVLTNPDGDSRTFRCRAEGSLNRIQEGENPTDPNYLTSEAVSIVDCQNIFVLSDPNPGYEPKTVFISFTLRQADSTARATETATENFQLQITMRNE